MLEGCTISSTMPVLLKEKSILCGSVLGAETIRLGVYAGGVALYNILSS